MKKLFLITRLLLFAHAAISQNIFQEIFPGQAITSCTSVIPESDSGYSILMGRFINPGRATITRIDKQGSIQWTKTYRSGLYVSANMIRTYDGGFVISARSLTFSNVNYQQLLKLDNTGIPVWTRRYTGGTFNHGYVMQTSDSGLVLYGKSDTKMYLIRTNSLGDTLWTRFYFNSNSNNYINSVDETSDHGFIITGTYWAVHYHSFLIRTNASGNILWARNFDTADVPYLKKVLQTPDGGFLASGIIWDASSQTILLKTDSAGNLSWNKLYLNAQAGSIKKALTGDYFLYGETNHRDTADYVLMKINASGDTLWTREYGLDSISGEYMDDAVLAIDNGFMLCGRATAAVGAGYIVKTDQDGYAPCKVYQPQIVISQATYSDSALAFTQSSGFSTDTYPDTMSAELIVDSLVCESSTGINEPSAYSWLTLFPNPAQGSVTVSFENVPALIAPRLLVYDGIGKLVKYESGEMLLGRKQVELDVKDLSQGVYYIVLVNDSKIAGLQKFVKL